MHIMKKQVLLIILLALPLWLKAADVSVTGLRTEQMVDPMGLDTAVPRMSWRLESSQRNVMQTAYRILVASSPELLAQDKGDLWDSGKVESDASVWIPYEGKRLISVNVCLFPVGQAVRDGFAWLNLNIVWKRT